MARNIRAPRLENRSNRLKLPIAKKPVYVKIDRGIALGYRRNAGPGSWIVRTTRGGEDWTARIGDADDFEEASSGHTMTFWDAQVRAREIALGRREDDVSKPATVAMALDAYETDLRARGGNPYNAVYVRTLLPSGLATKAVALLTAKELRHWRDGLLKRGLAPPSVTRAGKSFKAALNLTASHDPRITNTSAWRIGIAGLPDAESRNTILPEESIRAIVAAAWELDAELGLFVEVIATTGTRPSQAARLNVGDLKYSEGAAPWLSMPSSRKGQRQKAVTHRPVPITPTLAAKLQSNRAPDEPLLLRRGERWGRWDHSAPVARAVKRAGLDPAVTIYALRHSSIVRQLIAHVPIRVVAVNHDTSVVMIEKAYSVHIGAHSDEVTRGALLDLGAASTTGRVAPILAERRD